ncbi:MAG: DUF4365 domain-containing protein [Cyclobacteriaceae bacterium]
MTRFDKTERLGIIASDLVVTNELDWIFREQPLVDVGVDAIIEQSENGNPTGKFFAAQIKSGRGNFHLTEKCLTYYLTNVHYHYWSNFNIPVIIIAHLPESGQTYWQHLHDKSFRKTKKRWKVEIPFNQKFNVTAKSRLTNILADNSNRSIVFELYKGNVEEDDIYDLVEKSECILDSVVTINKIIDGIKELQDKTSAFNAKLRKFVNDGYSDQDAHVKASIKGFGKDMNISSKRLETEIELYAELYSEGIFAFEELTIIFYLLTRDAKTLDIPFKQLLKIPEASNEAVAGINVMRSGVQKLPTKYAVLKEAKLRLLSIIDMMIDEINESKNMAEKIIDKIEGLK